MDQICVVTTVVDDRAAADQLARTAVAARLAACAQVGDPVDSTYWWRSELESAREWTVQFKTALDRADRLVAHLRANHPYQVPEILMSRVDCPNPDYAAWVREQTRQQPASSVNGVD